MKQGHLCTSSLVSRGRPTTPPDSMRPPVDLRLRKRRSPKNAHSAASPKPPKTASNCHRLTDPDVQLDAEGSPPAEAAGGIQTCSATSGNVSDRMRSRSYDAIRIMPGLSANNWRV